MYLQRHRNGSLFQLGGNDIGVEETTALGQLGRAVIAEESVSNDKCAGRCSHVYCDKMPGSRRSGFAAAPWKRLLLGNGSVSNEYVHNNIRAVGG
jgi:hypothetical protein